MALTNSDYTVGWISALPVEMAAAKAMMEKPLHPQLPQSKGDNNRYVLGRIGQHNVVMACLPGIGTVTAAHAAANLLRSFPNVRFGLMVGTGGGVPASANPGTAKDIRLGDVVVSSPGDQHGGVIQYDFGSDIRVDQQQRFKRKGHLNKPPSLLIATIRDLESSEKMEPSQFLQHYKEMLEKYPRMAMSYFKPHTDKLFASSYQHQGGSNDCSLCSNAELLARQPRQDSVVHYGLIGSANRVLKDPVERDRLHAHEGIICFETEAAGLMDEFSCVVIRGICDYCDSHKSEYWQSYASAVAAAFAKDLLLNIPTTVVETLPYLTKITTIVEKQEQIRQAIHKIDTKLDTAEDASKAERRRKCLDNLKCIHPRYDKKRLVEAKGGLLRDAYRWILQNQEYMDWRTNGGLLWIKGDPGKGKTMLMCGVIDELNDRPIYFFCQATINKNNTSTWALRGLIFSILDQYPDLSSSVYDKIQQASDLPHNTAFYVLSDALEELLASRDMVVMVDALDECLEGLDQLLLFIVKASTTYSSSWLVSSRNILDIGEHLEKATRLSLELNDFSVASAVKIFIQYKVKELSQVKKYDTVLQEMVLEYLLSNAQGTFLWVSLVCLNLAKARLRNTKVTLLQYPSGLTATYQHMLESIGSSTDADALKQVLTTACVVFRPLSLAELSTIVQPPKDQDTLTWTEDLVNDCGCFFNIRDSVVEFVHQSAKDFLVKQWAKQIFPDGLTNIHQHVFVRSIEALKALHRNMYSLTEPGIDVKNISVPQPDPLADMKYASIYWIDHILKSLEISTHSGISVVHAEIVLQFMRTRYLYWLEALSLLGGVHPAILTMTKLHSELHRRKSQVITSFLPEFDHAEKILFDALQFMRFFQRMLASFPLQIYISGLLFSPQQSLIKHHFRDDAPKWIGIKRGLHESWPRSLALDHEVVNLIRWSPDGKKLATSSDHVLNVWDSETGQLLASLARGNVSCAFSTDGHTLMIISEPCIEIELWSFIEDRFIATVELRGSSLPRLKNKHQRPGDINGIIDTSPSANNCSGKEEEEEEEEDEEEYDWHAHHNRVVFSRDTLLIASFITKAFVTNINRTASGALIQRLNVGRRLLAMAFSTDNRLFAAAISETIIIWTIDNGVVFRSIPRMGSYLRPILVFSPCSMLLAVIDEGLQLWDIDRQTSSYSIKDVHIQPDLPRVAAVAFHPQKSSLLICRGSLLEEWSTLQPVKLGVCEAFPRQASKVEISISGHAIAAGDMMTIRVWHLDRETEDHPNFKEPRTAVSAQAIRLVNDKVYAFGEDLTCQVHVWPALLHGEGKPILNSDFGHGTRFYPLSDGSQVLAFHRTNDFLEVWYLHDGNETRMRISDRDRIAGLCWGPGENEVTILDYKSQSLSCWCAKKVQITMQLPYPTSAPVTDTSWTGLCWSPTKTHLVCALRGELYLWDSQDHTWSVLSNGENKHYSCKVQAFSTDGHLYANTFPNNRQLYANTPSNNSVHVFRVQTRALTMVIPFSTDSMFFSFDSQWLETDRGWYPCPSLEDPSCHEGIPSQPSEHLNMRADLRSDRSWIRSGSDNIIWLPPEYRPLTNCGHVDDPYVALFTGDSPLVVLEVHWSRSKGLASRFPSDSNQNSRQLHKRKRSS